MTKLLANVDVDEAKADLDDILDRNGKAIRDAVLQHANQQLGFVILMVFIVFLLVWAFLSWSYQVFWGIMIVLYILVGGLLLFRRHSLIKLAGPSVSVFTSTLKPLFHTTIEQRGMVAKRRGAELILQLRSVNHPDRKILGALLPAKSQGFPGKVINLYVGKYRPAKLRIGGRNGLVFYIAPAEMNFSE